MSMMLGKSFIVLFMTNAFVSGDETVYGMCILTLFAIHIIEHLYIKGLERIVKRVKEHEEQRKHL